jgi:hypothetical protein
MGFVISENKCNYNQNITAKLGYQFEMKDKRFDVDGIERMVGMKVRYGLLVALLITATPAYAGDSNCSGSVCLQTQVKSLSCLKSDTRKLVEAIVARIGEIEITSTCGGHHAKHSAHYSGMAIDFRPKAVPSRTAVAQLHSLPQARGIGSYSNGLVHADVADRDFAWHGRGSGRKATRLANR